MISNEALLSQGDPDQDDSDKDEPLSDLELERIFQGIFESMKRVGDTIQDILNNDEAPDSNEKNTSPNQEED